MYLHDVLLIMDGFCETLHTDCTVLLLVCNKDVHGSHMATTTMLLSGSIAPAFTDGGLSRAVLREKDIRSVEIKRATNRAV